MVAPDPKPSSVMQATTQSMAAAELTPFSEEPVMTIFVFR